MMQANPFFRAISAMVLVAFTSLTMQPLSAAMQMKRTQEKNAPAPKSADEKYAQTLDALEEQSKRARNNRKKGKPSQAEAKQIRQLKKELDQLNGEVEAALATTGKHIENKKLAQVIRDRHNEAVQTFKAKRAEFAALLAPLENKGDNASDAEVDASLTALSTFFDTHSQSRKRAKLDPNNLPWRSPKAQVREPALTAQDFNTAFFDQDHPKLAGAIPDGGLRVAQYRPTIPPGAAELAETEDVQLTPAIRVKAAELGNNPVAIYYWTRNNIRFVPTFGSVQGAQDTLDKLAGNAFDTSSLLIALLRAAGIHARYAYATVEAPAEQVMNWVGGVTKIEAAQQLLGQGGIPNVAVVSGGKITAIKIEHCFVEAWLDYEPSRGARHVQGDTWIPLDASFKQYAFTQGMNLKEGVPFDANAFLTSARQGATVNEQQGWVQNLNQSNIQTNLTNYQNQLKTYVDSQKANATVGDVLGTQVIIARNYATLSPTIPFKVVAKGPKYVSLPDSLRHQFQYKVYASDHERNIDSPTLTFQRSLPRLAGKKVTLSFKPATQADADLIASYLPQPHADGSPIQPSEFPSQIPAYAKVIPELRVEGEVVATGGTFTLGHELAGRGGFTQYDFSGWDLSNNDTLVAGQTTAIGISGQGIGLTQIKVHKKRIEQTSSALEGGSVQNLTGDQVIGDLLTATIWAYFTSIQAHGKLVQAQAGMVDVPALTFGMFHALTQPNKLYGQLTTSVKFPGVVMDIGHLRHVRWSRDHNQNAWSNYNRIRGQAASALESIVPEMFFIDRNSCTSDGNPSSAKPRCPQGISTIKALVLAQAEGQKVFTVTQSNRQVMDTLQLRSETLDEIKGALDAGKEVIVHENQVTVAGGGGVGYAIVDPHTGAGAYLIEGKANGGMLFLWAGALLAVFGLFFLPAVAGILLLVYGVHLVAIGTLIAFFEGIVDKDVLFVARHCLLVFALIFGPELIGSILAAIAVNAGLLNLMHWIF